MKVRAAFNFTEDELRSIRAAHGRGGKATRKESVTFIDRAVRKALDDAPEPKATRVKREKTNPSARAVVEPEQETVAAIAQRERIARLYRHGLGSLRSHEAAVAVDTVCPDGPSCQDPECQRLRGRLEVARG